MSPEETNLKGLVIEVIEIDPMYAPAPPNKVDPRCTVVDANSKPIHGPSSALVSENGQLLYIWVRSDTNTLCGKDKHVSVQSASMSCCKAKSADERMRNCNSLARISWFGPPGSRFLATYSTASSGTTSLSVTPLPSKNNMLFGNLLPPSANTGSVFSNSSFPSANTGSLVSNSSSNTFSNSPFPCANTSSVFSNSPFPSANTGSVVSNSSLIPFSNSSFPCANTGSVFNNSPFPSANTGSVFSNSPFPSVNTGSVFSNSLFTSANTGSVFSNSPFPSANTGSVFSNSSSPFSNSSFPCANTGSVFTDLTFPASTTTVNALYVNPFAPRTTSAASTPSSVSIERFSSGFKSWSSDEPTAVFNSSAQKNCNGKQQEL